MDNSFKTAVDEINKAFAKAYNNKDAGGCAATYTEDARIVYTDGKLMKGRKALIAALNEAFKANNKLVGYEVVKTIADGNVGYSAQVVTFTEAKAYVLSGYTRNASGRWLTDDEVAVSLST